MNEKPLFPLANEDDREGGWTFSVAFLKAIKSAAQTHGADTSLEAVEAILLAVQAHVILAISTHHQ
jgi:hypothetical protein